MKFLRYILIVLIVLISLFGLCVSYLGRRNAEFYDTQRIETLMELRNIYAGHSGNLFKTCIESNRELILPYTSGRGYIDLNIFKSKEKLFNKYIRYKVIKSDNWWGIIELEYGIKGKYFFLISEDGTIVKIDKPIIPEQKNAKYPPEFCKNGIDTLKIEMDIKNRSDGVAPTSADGAIHEQKQ